MPSVARLPRRANVPSYKPPTPDPRPDPAPVPPPPPAPAAPPSPPGAFDLAAIPGLPDGHSRMVLTIGAESYTVRLMPREPGDEGCPWYRLRKADGTAYHVLDVGRGLPAECDCPDHTFRRDGNDPEGCKHARALRKFGLLSAVVVAYPEADVWPDVCDDLAPTINALASRHRFGAGILDSEGGAR